MDRDAYIQLDRIEEREIRIEEKLDDLLESLTEELEEQEETEEEIENVQPEKKSKVRTIIGERETEMRR